MVGLAVALGQGRLRWCPRFATLRGLGTGGVWGSPRAGNGGAAGRGCNQAPRESGRRVEGAHKSGTYGRRHAQAPVNRVGGSRVGVKSGTYGQSDVQAPRQSAPRAEVREKATKCVAFSLRLVLSGPRGSGVGVSAMREFALPAIGLSAGARRPDRRWRRRTRVGAESRIARRIPHGRGCSPATNRRRWSARRRSRASGPLPKLTGRTPRFGAPEVRAGGAGRARSEPPRGGRSEATARRIGAAAEREPAPASGAAAGGPGRRRSGAGEAPASSPPKRRAVALRRWRCPGSRTLTKGLVVFY